MVFGACVILENPFGIPYNRGSAAATRPRSRGTAETMVRHIVRFIRRGCGEEAPIIIRLDAGFFYQDLFQVFVAGKIGSMGSKANFLQEKPQNIAQGKRGND